MGKGPQAASGAAFEQTSGLYVAARAQPAVTGFSCGVQTLAGFAAPIAMPTHATLPLFLLVACLQACGGGGGDATPAAPSPAPAPAPSPAPAPAPAPAPPAPAPAPAPATPTAGNPVVGRALYTTICVNCHAPDPDQDLRGLRRADAQTILNAINNVNQMRFLRGTIGPQEAADLAAWLANPGL